MAASVQVLCPNGHRQNIKVTPNTKLLQVLEEVCTKQGFHPASEYALKHGRTIVDVTLSFRYSGLANHAKLELVKSQVSRAESSVTLALQLETGQRLQHEFSPGTSLWQVLEHWHGQPDSGAPLSKSEEPDVHPVCIYMREEVVGELALQETTLRSLGMTGGRGIIRLVHRKVDESKLQEVKEKIEKEKERQARLTSKSVGKAASAPVPGASTTSQPEGSTSSVSQSKSTSAVGSTGHQPEASSSSTKVQGETESSKSSVPSAEPMDIETQSSHSDSMIVDSGGSASSSEHAQKEEPMEAEASTLASTSKLNRSHATETNSASTSKPKEERTGQEQGSSRPSASGALQSLANIPGVQVFAPGDFNNLTPEEQRIARQLMQSMGFGTRPSRQPQSEFKFPEETKGKAVYKNELSEVNRKEFEPCDRETVIFNMETRSPTLANEELPDDFFQLTEKDVRRMMKDLQNTVSSEAPLMTQAMRQSQLAQRMSKYKHVIIRVHFPDKHIMQGVFRTRESVLALHKYVKEHLEDKSTSFYLYTAPPKKVLKDMTLNLFEADLAPMSVVYFGSEVHKDHYLSSAVLNEVATEAAADNVVAEHMGQRDSADVSQADQGAATAGASAGPSNSTYKRPKASSSMASGSSQSKQTPSDAPKWFKMGKK